MDFGIIGNCQYNALIDRRGEVVWLCWPRFDSSFVFGSLLDKNVGGYFRIYPSKENIIGNQQYIINTNVLKTTFTDQSNQFEIIDFAPRFSQGQGYFKQPMLIRIIRPVDGESLIRVNIKPVYDYGKIILKPILGSNYIEFEGAPHSIRLTTDAPLALIHEDRPFILDKTYYFVFSWGTPVEENLQFLCEQYLEKTVSYWQTWVKHCYLPKDFQNEIIRSALVLKIHQFEDTGAIIASTTTSIPEAKDSGRNWDYRYCWLRDAMFSLIALLRLTQFEELEKFVFYLRNIVETNIEENLRLQPVYGISGERVLTESILDHLDGYQGQKPVRIGNQAYEHLQHDVYGEMILGLSPLFLDQRFVNSWNLQTKSLLESLLKSIERYLESKDAGLWEFRGISQLHTFSLLMHWAGSALTEQISRKHQFTDLQQRAAIIRKQSAEIIYQKCWNEQKKAFTQAMNQNALDASLLMLINIGFLNQKNQKALSHLDAIATELKATDGFIYRYIHQDDFGDTKNAFLICSFWLAEAYARLGKKDKAQEIFQKLLKSANHLGLYSEDLNIETGELWGNFPQTYSHVGLINAAFCLSPPESWPSYFSPDELV